MQIAKSVRVVVVALVLASCADGPEKPYFELTINNEDAEKHFAVDSQKHVWRRETLHYPVNKQPDDVILWGNVSTVTADQFARIQKAFDGLPASTSDCALSNDTTDLAEAKSDRTECWLSVEGTDPKLNEAVSAIRDVVPAWVL